GLGAIELEAEGLRHRHEQTRATFDQQGTHQAADRAGWNTAAGLVCFDDRATARPQPEHKVARKRRLSRTPDAFNRDEPARYHANFLSTPRTAWSDPPPNSASPQRQ